MQAVNDILDVNSGAQQISSRISALKTSVETFANEKNLKNKFGNSFQKAQGEITSQLDKIKDLQKRYQREPPNSMDQLLGFLGQTRGQGSATLIYLRKKLLEVSATLGPTMGKILNEESIKALGCSQEQTYNGFSSQSLQINPISTIPQAPNDGFVYIPVQSIDLLGNLKNSTFSLLGKLFYEKEQPSASPRFKPFGGSEFFPMNKQLHDLMQSNNANRSMSQILGQNYRGVSGQPVFDVQYTTTNGFGISGNFFKVALIDRENNSGITVNKVGQFISDYYSTIKIIDNVYILAQLINFLCQAVSIKAELGVGELQNQGKFALIIQRILGLCFDERREIDVSGISKVGELDGVDESFFELNEIDLRNLDQEISNIQRGVMEFVDCENVKLPVNSDNLVEQIAEFRDASPQTIDEIVKTSEEVIDSIYENPEWKALIPNSFNVQVAINKEVLKKLPLAVASAVLTPAVLLPLFTVMAVTQSAATFTYNSVVTSANTFINSANTIITSANTIVNNVGAEGSNVITDGSDFLKKWKTFSIGVVSRINAEFLKALYEVLKRDILNLTAAIIRDIERSEKLKKYAIILRLLEIAIVVAQLIGDYRRCKSLLSNILLLLNLINGLRRNNDIPLGLLLASKFLPGFSPERAAINTTEILQQLGIPTGALPDGSPNLMNLMILAGIRGTSDERNKNEKLQVVLDSPITGTGKAI